MAIYFDNAATSYPKPEEVYNAVDYYQRHIGASPGRGAYRNALEADQIIFKARQSLAKLFGAICVVAKICCQAQAIILLPRYSGQ